MQDVYPVYVVDDDPSVRAWAALACEERSLACRTFADGAEFLTALDDLAPGCVLLDMRMPRPNGLQVQAEIARRGRPLAIIAMTGFGGVDTAVQSIRMGAVDFLEKPFSMHVLFEALERAFAQLGEQATLASPD